LLNLFSNLSKKGKYLLLTFLLLNFLHASSFIEDINTSKLYNNPYWSKLLHYRDGHSEIDSRNFFVSDLGKSNLKEELLETIDSLVNGKNNILCRFPLRVKWLKKNIDTLERKIVNYECKDLDIFLNAANTKQVTLVFPTAHINSPASMYGHTFLRLAEDKNTPLISNAVNYAAKTKETNGLVFAYKGIFGGYEGRYSILPYYKKIKEYNNLEQRDIWEYELDFKEDEIDNILLHTYELKDSYSDYFFFKENCSYNVLWLLEIARPKLDLVNNFDYKTIPLDTIKLLKPYNIIKESNFRPSKMLKMKHILNNKIKNKNSLYEFVNNDINLDEKLSTEDKISYLDFKIEYLQYIRSKNKIDKKKYLNKYLKLLRLRSSFHEKSTYDIKKPFNPIYSHHSARVSFFFDTKDNIDLGYKPAYNDLYDINDGYLQGAYIDFFDINIKKEKKKVFLEKASLLKIKSYANRDMFFKPLSWGIDLGYQQFLKKEYLNFNPEIGLSFGNAKEFLYLMLDSKVFYNHRDSLYSYGANIGFVTNRFKNMKVGLKHSYNKYNKNIENNLSELFVTYKIKNNLSLNAKYINNNLHTNDKQNVKMGVFFYF
jgi:hypothetical protein